MSRARKSHDGIKPYKIQDRKNARRKKEKNGGQGYSHVFKEVEGGGHTVSNRGYSPFFCYLNILGCLFEKRLKKGILGT